MELSGVIAAARRLGPIAHLATVSPAGGPHVVPVHCEWLDDRLYCTAGQGDTKVRNLAAQPRVCIHYQVAAATGWDSLIIWGTGAVLDAVADKRLLWNRFGYDLDEFSPGGPEGSPDTVFIEIEPRRALLLLRYGLDGREEWTVGG